MKLRHFLHTIVLLLFLSHLTHSWASDLNTQRTQFNLAYQALKANQFDAFLQLSESLTDYPLYSFLYYIYLKPRLQKVSASEIEQFINRYGDSRSGEMLRQDWLTELARQGNWSSFLRLYTPQKSAALQCSHAQARLETGQNREVALQDLKELWLVGKSQPESCNAAFAHLYNSPIMTNDLLWQRIRMAMDQGQLGVATIVSNYLSSTDQSWIAQWQAMHANPVGMLAQFNGSDVPVVREIILHGIKQVAKKQFDLANEYWTTYQRRYAFSTQQIGELQRDLALIGAKQNHPEALRWLTAVHKDYLNADVNKARIEIALRRQEWRAVADFITELPESEKKVTQWQYWYARALGELKEKSKEGKTANQLFKEFANERDYYGFLAAERAEVEYPLRNQPSASATPLEETQLLNNLSIASASEFFQLGMLADGRREWDYVTERLAPRQKIVAAQLAQRWGWYDRAAITATKSEAFNDLQLRFPTPYRSQATLHAEARGLDLAWVYGIIRQESAYMPDVKSSAGALGLMQLMPATARHVAKKEGISIKGNQDILDIDTNISLGTAYLRQMLDKFNGNYLMATAAYNAGPGRPARWITEYACLPADIWVEMIPFNETREYVRRVLTYTKIFESLLGLQQTSMRVTLAPNEYCPMGSFPQVSQQGNDPAS